MKCQELLRLLGDYVDGEVDPAVCEEFARHLDHCRPCRIVVDTVRKTVTLYRGDEQYELPAEFRDRLHRTLRERWKETRGPAPSGQAPVSEPEA